MTGQKQQDHINFAAGLVDWDDPNPETFKPGGAFNTAMRQAGQAVRGRRKFVHYPDGTKYTVVRKPESDYTCDTTGIHFHVWDLEQA